MEEKFSYEVNISEIKSIIQKLKDNPSQFEENFRLFRKAMTLIQKCKKYISEAEMQVKKIVDGQIQDFEEKESGLVPNNINSDSNDFPF